MAYEIVWTSEADNDLRQIVSYLKEEWSHETAQRFITRTLNRLEKLIAMPSIARNTSKQNTFMWKLDHKNVGFFY